jgi:electron transport complex protein RnfA
METFTRLFELFIAASLINNFVFTLFLGLCIFFGVSKKMETAVGMSITFGAVMVITAAISWLAWTYVMVPLEITFLKIIIFIGVVAAFVQAADTIMRKISPGLYYKLGVYLALIATNCIILAVPIMNAGSASPWPSSSWPASGRNWSSPRCPDPSREPPSPS